MTTQNFAPARPRRWTLENELWTLWLLFIGVHAFYGWVASWHPSVPFNDVTGVYRGWVESAIATGSFPGVHEPFVYPVGALGPMLLTNLIGPGEAYGLAWMIIVIVLDCIALWWLTMRQNTNVSAGMRRTAAWWWLAFLVLLGPIALGRIDTLTVPIVLIALLEIRSRVRTSGFWLTIGAWFKVWPAAAFAGAFAVIERRWKLVQGALIGCVVVLLPVMVFNGTDGLRNAFSFVTGQTGRGLQLESAAASVFLVFKSLGNSDYEVRFDYDILTQQISGPGVDLVGDLLTPLMFVMVLILLALGFWWHRKGAGMARVFPALLLALVTSFIVFNKVGSPQFMTWLAPIIVLGLVWDGRRFAPLAWISLVIAGLTQYIYPWFYWTVVGAAPIGAFALFIRNALLVVLLVAAVMYMRPLKAEKVTKAVGGSATEPASSVDDADASSEEGTVAS
jgi:hypothetical protein